jgi:hypothetical protein
VEDVPDPSQLPDYATSIAPLTATSGSRPVLADADGNVWIREVGNAGADGGAVFALVNRSGRLFDRVQIPGGTRIVGFGPGVVYLSARVGRFQSLVRARIR